MRTSILISKLLGGLALAVLFLGGNGCISNKKVTYLQGTTFSDSTGVSRYQPSPYSFALRPGDILQMDVFSLTNEKFNFLNTTEVGAGLAGKNMGYTVDPEGYLQLPVIDTVYVQGLSLQQAENKVETRYKDLLDSPVVRMRLLSFQFTVLGEVNAPGRYAIDIPGLTLIEALAMAGDLTEFGNRETIQILRKAPTGEVTKVRLNVLDESVFASDHYYVRPNDIIIIDPLRAREVRQQQFFVFSTVLGFLTSMATIIIALTR